VIPDFVKRGQKVRLKDDEQAAKWLIDINSGTVVESRAYGPNEAMVTVDFVTRRIHVSHVFLEAADA
jgi:hypothetical protein